MQKTRNSFFTEANMNYSGAMNMPIPPNNMPYQASTNYNSFYSGPNMNNQNYDSSIDSRLAKMERQINRLDHRISKLESINQTYIDDIDTSNNMYML